MEQSEKEKIIKEAIEVAAKILALAFKVCELETHIESMVIDQDTKEEFVIKFYAEKGFDRIKHRKLYKLQCTDEDGLQEINGYFLNKENAKIAKNKLDNEPRNIKYGITQCIIEIKTED